MTRERIQFDQVAPGDLYLTIRGREARAWAQPAPWLAPIELPRMERRDDRGMLLRVVSTEGWPLVLCELLWDDGTDGRSVAAQSEQEPPSPMQAVVMGMRGFGFAPQAPQPRKEAPGALRPWPRFMLDFHEVRLRKVSIAFAESALGEPLPPLCELLKNRRRRGKKGGPA